MPGESFDILGTLVVVVLKAQNLIDNHKFYKQDPYAQISLNGTTQKTPVDPKGGQHPVWDEEFRFPIPKGIAGKKRILTVACYSQEKKQDALLGEGEIDIGDTLRSGEFDDWVPLKIGDTQRGDVYLEMTFFAAGPAPINRRKSKFTPQERLARPPQERLPPSHSRPPYASHSHPNTPPQQYLGVPGSRSHSSSPKDPDSALPPVPPEPAVPAILRAGPGARPRVASDVGFGARPAGSSYAGDGPRPTSQHVPRRDSEPELPTPTQHNPHPRPPYLDDVQTHPETAPTGSHQRPNQHPPRTAPARATSHQQPPPAEPYVSSYPPYNAPTSAPVSSAPASPPYSTVSTYPASSLPPAGFAFPVPDATPASGPPGGYHAPVTYPPASQYRPNPPGNYGPPHAPYTQPTAPYSPSSSPYPPSNLPYHPSSSPYPAPPGGFPYGRGPSSRSSSQNSNESLPDPYLERRYQTPLPLPRDEQPHHVQQKQQQPQPRPVPAVPVQTTPAPAPASVRMPQPNPDELAARELQMREEEEARMQREQEERDLALARSLDLELNLGPDEAGTPSRPPASQREASGVHMPGAW